MSNTEYFNKAQLLNQYDRDTMATIIINLQSENASLKALLKELEWRATDGHEHYCLYCYRDPIEGHSEDCKLSKALQLK